VSEIERLFAAVTERISDAAARDARQQHATARFQHCCTDSRVRGDALQIQHDTACTSATHVRQLHPSASNDLSVL